MAVKYYLSSSDSVTGPYAKEELLDSLKYGVIAQSALICEEGTENWVPVSTLSASRSEIVATPFTEMRQGPPPGGVTVYNQYYEQKSTGLAVLLEVLPGITFQTFGIGNMYAGNLTLGLVLMLSYWAFQVVNFLLIFVGIGLLTMPATFIVYLVVGIITAQNAAARANWDLYYRGLNPR